MKKEIPVVFQHGVKQSVDKRTLPLGWFASATNSRFRKDGRLGKRYGYATRANTGLTDTNVQALASAGGTDYAVAGGFLHAWDGAAWQPSSAPVSHWTPEKEHLIAAPEQTTAVYPSVAVLSNAAGTYRFLAWQQGTVSTDSKVFVRCENVDTGATIFIARVDSATTATEPKVVSSSNAVFVVWREGTEIKQSYCSPGAGVPATFAAEQSLATGITANAGFDACSTSTSVYGLVYQSSTNQLTLARCNTTGVLDSTSWSDATDTLVASVVEFETTSVDAWCVAWRVVSTDDIKAKVYNFTLASATSTLTVDSTTTNALRPVVGWLSNSGSTSTLYVFWTETETAGKFQCSKQIQYSYTGPTLTLTGSLLKLPRFSVASKPVNVDGALYQWAVGGSIGTATAGMYLLEMVYADGTDTLPRIHMRHSYGNAFYAATLYGDFPGEMAFDGVAHNWAFNYVLRGVGTSPQAIAASNLRLSHMAYKPQRATAQAAGVLYVAGGQVVGTDGRWAVENGFNWAPTASLAQSAGGGLTALGTYQYVVVYEWVDAAKNRHLSQPSAAVSITLTAGNGTVTVTYTGLDYATFKNIDTGYPPVARIYRTANNGRVFTEVTSAISTALTVDPTLSSFTYTFVDAASDTTIAGNEALYTHGRLPLDLAPACGHLWVGKDRACASRLPNRSIAQFSGTIVPNEPLNWVDDDAFRVVVRGDIECAAEMDGVWYLFTATEIYAVTGDGPDDSGLGEFAQPVRLPSPTGCDDWRSLVLLPAGLMFKGGSGLHLLPRGTTTPIWIGEDVQDTIGADSTVVGAAYDEDENSAIFAASDGSVAVLDLRLNEWLTDSFSITPVTLGLWAGVTAIGGSTGALQVRGSGWTDGSGTDITQTLQTGEVTPFGLDGFGRVRRLWILGEFRSNATLTASAYFDGESTPSTASWSLATPTYAAGDRFELQWDLPRQKLTSISFKLVDSSAGEGGTGEGLVLHGITLGDITPKAGGTKRPATSRY